MIPCYIRAISERFRDKAYASASDLEIKPMPAPPTRSSKLALYKSRNNNNNNNNNNNKGLIIKCYTNSAVYILLYFKQNKYSYRYDNDFCIKSSAKTQHIK